MRDEPAERRSTVREALRVALRDGPLTAHQLSARVGVREREVAAHLEHLARSLRSRGERLQVEPARCLACGFRFTKRDRLTRPSSCPTCKSQRVEPPRFALASAAGGPAGGKAMRIIGTVAAFLAGWAVVASASAEPRVVAPGPRVSVAAAAETAATDAGPGEGGAAPVEAAGHGEERYRLVSRPDEIVSILANGLTVIVKRVPSPALAVRGYVRAGSIHEGRWLGGGLSHLLEHLVAGGATARRSEPESRALLQRLGNSSNAYTSLDHTAYFITTTPEHLVEAVDLLTDWLFRAKVTEEEYRREYEVVQRELEQGKGQPRRQFAYVSAGNRYRVHPAGVPIIGFQEVIRRLTRDDVYEYYRLAYQPANVVLVVVGDRDPEEMLGVVRQHVDDAPPGRVFPRALPAEPPVLGPRTVVAAFPKLGQALLELGFPSIPLDHPDLYALDLLSAVLSGGESALLVEEIRDRRRLVSSIRTGSYTPEFVEGTFDVEMRLDADQIPAATAAVLEVLERVARDGVADARVERAKTQMKVGRIRGLQTAEGMAASLATDFLSTGDPHFTDRYIERIAAVTAADVQAMARKYLDPTRLLTTAMVPAEWAGAQGLPKAEELVRAGARVAAGAEPARSAASAVTRVTLENGTVLLHKRITTTPLVVTAMYALGGLTAEDESTNGLGNLALELLPRGTTTRTAQEIAAFFDAIGGTLATGMGNNTWSWSATALREDFPRALEVLADVVLHPAFPGAELEALRARVLAAIDGQDADWTSQAFRFFKQVYWGPAGSPYRFVARGTRDNVARFTRDQVARWYAERVLTSPRVLAIFGDVELGEAERLARAHLSALPAVGPLATARRGRVLPHPRVGPPAVEVERVEVQRTQQPLAGIVIGFRSDAVIGEAAGFPLVIGDTMTSGYGYPTGYLHEVLRGRGLVYVVHAVHSPGPRPELPGTFLVYAGAEPGKVSEVVELILENVARLQGAPADVQPAWFERSKALILTSAALERETAGEQAQSAALDELFGLGHDFHERFPERIRAVTLDEVRAVAGDRLGRVVVAISTPRPDLVRVEAGRREYPSFPPVDLAPGGVQHDGGTGRP